MRGTAHWVNWVLDATNFALCVAAAGMGAATDVRLALGCAVGGDAGRPTAVVAPATEDGLRSDLRRLGPLVAVAVAFDRAAMGQSGGGHWSPAVAFNQDADMVLVWDTAARYGQYWVPVPSLYCACKTRNRYGQSRGWVVVHRA